MYKKPENGITLVALLVTIIILVILAAVAIINLADNGIIEKVQLAKEDYEIEQAREKIQLAIMEYKANMKKELLYKYLQKIENIESITSKKPEDATQGPPFTVVVDGYEFYIDEKLNVEYKAPAKGIVPQIIKIEHQLQNEREVIIKVSAKTKDDKGIKKIVLLSNGVVIGEKDVNGKDIEATFTVTSNGEYIIKVEGVNKKETFSEVIKVTEIVIFNGTMSRGTMLNRSVEFSVHGESNQQKIKKVEFYENEVKKDEKSYIDGIDELNEQFIIEEMPFYEKIKCYAVLIDEDGNRKPTNEIIVENTNEVANLIDLKKLVSEVNSDNKFSGETIKLLENIVLESNWVPIGSYGETNIKEFNGTFDGNDKEISNVFIDNNEDKTVGLFGFLGTDGAVKNLTVSGKIIQNNAARAGGGIVGRNEGTIENCVNLVNIEGVQSIGGISGNNFGGCIKECTNCGTVVAQTGRAGGIAGVQQDEGIIEKCKNEGNITSKENPSNQEKTQGTGGIAGRINQGGTILQCANKGNITATTGYFAGGIVGFAERGEIRQSYNTECKITVGINGAGGIIGRGDDILIRNCYNYFSSNEYYIYAGGVNVGGIVGTIIATATKATIQNSYSIGENITGGSNNHIGSIIGGNYNNITRIDNCYMLDVSSLLAIGQGGNDKEPNLKDIKTKTNSEFKADRNNQNSVVYLINKDNGETPLWGVESNKNKGYPYLIYAK